MNIDVLQSLMKENSIDAAIILSEENRRYFTSFPASDGVLAVCRDECVFYTDSRYIEAAENSIDCCEVREGKEQYKQLRDLFKRNNVKNIAVEESRMTLSRFNNLTKNEQLLDFEFISDGRLDTIVNALRSVKTEREINYVRQAQSIAEDAFLHILDFIKPGMTEKHVQLELDYYMLSHGAEALSFDTIAVAGKKTSMPHGVPGENVIKSGDFVTFDFGAVVNGYHSDMTRTVALGDVSEKQREVYNTVLSAHNAVLSTVKAGVTCREADAAARNVIKSAGYAECFGHGTGHGVGIEIHEYPFVSPRSDAVLNAGNIVTDEPGIYIPGQFGVRIEDMLLVTENGNVDLASSPKELIILR